MTTEIFNNYLKEINKKFKKENRLILLIINNATSHGKLNPLSNISILYIPPNTSALIQPLDQGIIKAMKDRYTVKLNNYVLSQLDNNNKLIYKTFNVLQPILWITDIWLQLDGVIIINCWRHSGLIYTGENVGADDSIADDEEFNFENTEDEDDVEDNDDEEAKNTLIDQRMEEIKIEDWEAEEMVLTEDEYFKGRKKLNELKELFVSKDLDIYSELLDIEKKLINKGKKEGNISGIKLFLVSK